MLRWLSFFGALALVISGVVFYLYKGPPESPFSVPQPGVQRRDADPAGPKPDLAGPKNVHAEPAQPAAPSQQGPWQGVMAITPRAAIPRARLEALQSPQVPALHEGQLLFLGTEVKPGEPVPPDAFRQEVAYLVTEVQPGDTVSPDDLEKIDGKSYRPLGKREPVVPYRVKLVFKEKAFRPVDEGTVVEKGQLLALIDPVTAVDELASRLAKFDAAESDRIASEKIRDFYKAQYDTRVELWRKGSATREEVNEAKAGWDRYTQETISKGEAVKVAARELRQAETLLQLHEIRSKINGKVKQPAKRKGEAVRSLDPVLEMVDLSKLRIRATVDLQDLGSLPDPNDPKDTRVVNVEAIRHVPPMLPNGILAGHMGEVTGVAVSKDNQIVSVSDDKTMRVWDLRLRRPRFKVEQGAPIRAVACTGPQAEKNLCLTGSADGTAQLYDLAAEKGNAYVRSLEGGHKAPITSVAFSADGRWAVTGGEDRAICLWDVDSGKLLQNFPQEWRHKQGVTSVAFLDIGPEDNRKLSVVSAGRDGLLIVWPLKADGAPEKPFRLPGRGGEVTTLGVNAKGNQLLFDQGRELRVLSSENAYLVGSLSATGGTNFSRLALFSPDGNLILTSNGPGQLGLWRAPTDKTRGHELEQLVWTSSRDEQAATTCGAFAPNGKFLVTGTQGRNVIVWPMPEKEDIERPLTAKVISVEPEVTSGQVRVALEIDKPPSYLLPGGEVTLVVYPEK